MKLRTALPLGLLALSALALAAQGVVLKRSPKAGDKATYKMTAKFDMGGADVAVSGTMTEEVKKVEGDTVTTDSSSKATVTFGGSDNDLPETKETSVTKLDGTLVSVKSGDKEAGADAIRLARLNLLVLPATPVEPNGTWSTEGKKDDKLGTPGYKIDYKLVGEDKVGAWDAYKIEVNGKETDGDSPSKWKATYWIAKTDGNLLRSVSDVTDVTYGPGITLSGKIEINRQP